MKKNIFILLSLCCAVFLTPATRAAWYEVTGTAAVVSTEDKARQNALEDALYKALSFTGGDIGSISSLMPLLENEKKEYQFAGHEVRAIRIEKSKVRNNVMQLKVRIDIYPSATSCRMSQYKKTILVGNIDIESPQQAVLGQIYNLGADFSRVFSRQLDQSSRSFVSVGTTQYELDAHYPKRLRMISQDTGAQYIVSGSITDLTSTLDQKMLADDIVNRQFALEMSIFDGKTGQEVYKQNYRDVARWPFSRTSNVDTKSARFWASSYGDMLLAVSRKMMLDMEAEISCKITLPEVVARSGNTVTIDLGRIHGVRTGDKLQLWHTGSFIDQRGISRNKVTQSDITLTVSRVYENEAELSVDQEDLAGSIQIGDVMHLKF